MEVSERGMTRTEHSKKVNELASKPGEQMGYTYHSKQASKLSDKEHSDEEVGSIDYSKVDTKILEQFGNMLLTQPQTEGNKKVMYDIIKELSSRKK